MIEFLAQMPTDTVIFLAMGAPQPRLLTDE